MEIAVKHLVLTFRKLIYVDQYQHVKKPIEPVKIIV